MSAFHIMTITLALAAVAWFLWRLLSNRRSIPCPAWLGWMVEMDNPFTKVSHAATIIKDSEIVGGMIVLDAGCGPGRVTIPAAKTVGAEGHVVALDIQAAMLAKVQAKIQKENLTNVEFLEAGLGSGKLKEEYFDRVLLVTVLGEIPDQESALKEIYHSLKPNGLLVITEIVFDPHFQRKSSVRKIAETTGFVEHSCHGGGLAYTITLKKHKTGKQE